MERIEAVRRAGKGRFSELRIRTGLTWLHSGKSARIRVWNHGSGVCKAHLRVVLCTKKLHFASRNWRMKN